MGLSTIKRSADFQRVRGGLRVATPLFVIETRPRAASSGGADSAEVRFGLTVTKKLGGAVVRNRIRRRIKAVLRTSAAGRIRVGHDYVIVARAGIIDYPYRDLALAFEQALDRLHGAEMARGGRGSSGAGHGTTTKRRDQSSVRDTASRTPKSKTQL